MVLSLERLERDVFKTNYPREKSVAYSEKNTHIIPLLRVFLVQSDYCSKMFPEKEKGSVLTDYENGQTYIAFIKNLSQAFWPK